MAKPIEVQYMPVAAMAQNTINPPIAKLYKDMVVNGSVILTAYSSATKAQKSMVDRWLHPKGLDGETAHAEIAKYFGDNPNAGFGRDGENAPNLAKEFAAKGDKAAADAVTKINELADLVNEASKKYDTCCHVQVAWKTRDSKKVKKPEGETVKA